MKRYNLSINEWTVLVAGSDSDFVIQNTGTTDIKLIFSSTLPEDDEADYIVLQSRDKLTRQIQGAVFAQPATRQSGNVTVYEVDRTSEEESLEALKTISKDIQHLTSILETLLVISEEAYQTGLYRGANKCL